MDPDRRVHLRRAQPVGGAPAASWPSPGQRGRTGVRRRDRGVLRVARTPRVPAGQLADPRRGAAAHHGRPSGEGPWLARARAQAARSPVVGAEERAQAEDLRARPRQARAHRRDQSRQGGLLDHPRPHHHRLPLAVHAARGARAPEGTARDAPARTTQRGRGRRPRGLPSGELVRARHHRPLAHVRRGHLRHH